MATAAAVEAELPPLPELPDVNVMFPPCVRDDKLTKVCRKFWNVVSEEGTVNPDAYRAMIRLVVRLTEAGDEAAADIICQRVAEIDTEGADIPFSRMKNTLHAIANTILPTTSNVNDVALRLESLFNEVMEEDSNPPPDHDGSVIFRLKAFTDIKPNKGYAPLNNLIPLVPGVQSKQLNNFVILGDPSTGKSELAEVISSETNALNLNIVELALNEIREETEVGTKLLKLVTNNEAIPVEQQAALIGDLFAASSLSVVEQRGFVFSEFPPLPASAEGDDKFSSWFKWCRIPQNANIISITCNDSLEAGDEWTACYQQRQQQLQREAAAEHAAREAEAEELQNLTKRFRQQVIPKGGDDDPDAEASSPAEADANDQQQQQEQEEEQQPEEEEDEEAVAKSKQRLAEIESRRLLFDVKQSVHKGWAAFFGSDWEGDTPFISPSAHSDIAPLIERSSTRGCYFEVPHFESARKQFSLISEFLLPSPTDLATCPAVPEPAADVPVADAENEFFEAFPGGRPPFSAFKRIDPVAHRRDQITVEGLFYHLSVYKGKAYFFVNEDNKHTFAKTPGHFADGDILLQNQIILMLAKHPSVLEHINSNNDQVLDEVHQKMKYTPIALSDYRHQWTATLADYRTKIAERESFKEEVMERLRQEEEEKNKEKKKAGKKKDAKKKKKKDDEEVPQAEPEPEQEKTETKELTVQEAKDKEVATALENKKKTASLMVHSFLMDSDEDLKFLKEENLVPNTILLLDLPPPPKPETDEEEDQQPPEDDPPEEPETAADRPVEAAPQPASFSPSDPDNYRKLVQSFIDEIKPAPPEGEDSTPSGSDQHQPSVHVVDCTSVTDHEDLIHYIQDVIDPFIPKAVSNEPVEEEADGEEEDKPSDAKDPRLIPGSHQQGATARYCQIALRDGKMFRLGNPKVGTVDYRGRRFVFSTEAAKASFLSRPWDYSRPVPEENWPRPSFFMFGNNFCFEEEITKSLFDNFGVRHINFDPDSIKAVIELISSTDPDNAAVAEALAISKELTDFDEKQQALILKQKESTDEDPETEFEPEEEEAKEERITIAHLRILKHALQCKPFSESGYLLTSVPRKEPYLDHLITTGIIPEAVIQVKIDKATYLRRTLPLELKQRKAAYEDSVAAQKKREAERKEAEKKKDLEKWRKRNVGGVEDDEEAAEDEEPTPEVVEEDVVNELSTRFDEEMEAAEMIAAKLKDQQIPTFAVDCIPKPSVVLTTVGLKLKAHLPSRSSLLKTPYLISKDDADRMLRHGTASLSQFRHSDPVVEFDHTSGITPPVRIKDNKRNQMITACYDEPPPPDAVVAAAAAADAADDKEEDGDDDEPPYDPSSGLTLEEEELDELVKLEAARREQVEHQSSPRFVFFEGLIYKLTNDDNVIRFLENPVRISSSLPRPRKGIWLEPQRGTHLPIQFSIPSVVLIVGEPGRADTRTLAEQAAYNMGAVHINKSKLIKTIINTNTVLGKAVRKMVVEETEISAKIFSKMLAARLTMFDVMNKGCVLDGIPDSIQLAEKIVADVFSSISVHKVIVQGDTQFTTKLQTIAQCYGKQFHDCVLYLSTDNKDSETPTPLTDLVKTLSAVEESAAARQRLTYNRLTGQASDLRHTSVRESYIQERLGRFKKYCAAEWVDNKKLVDCSTTDVDAIVAEYAGSTYYFSSCDNLNSFLKSPARFRESDAYELPEHLPLILSQEEADEIQTSSWEYKGCCPMTLYETRDTVGLKGEKRPTAVIGSNEYAAVYQGRYYRMVSEDARKEFIKQPWVFIEGSSQPKKLPVPKNLLFQTTDVKTEEYIRESLYESVVKAIVATARTRPGFPGSSLKSSGISYLASYLKAHNPANTPLKNKVYQKNLADYTEACTLVDFFLSPEAKTASKEVVDRKKKLWQDIRSKKVEPSTFENFNISSD